MPAPIRLAQRAQRVAPFYVMELAKAAQAMAAQGGDGQRRMLYLNIGEPDFTAPPLVQAAAERGLLLVKGSVPGPNGGVVIVRNAVKGKK